MSELQTQKEAVFTAVTSVVRESGSVIEEGQAVNLTREQRAQVTAILVEGFKSNKVSLDKTFTNDSGLRTYCSGLTSNWLKKDKRLNGGMQFAVKRPGSRVGSGDAQVRALRALMSTKTEATEIAEIQSFIDRRLAEIKPAAKTKMVSINAADLPAELQHLIK